MWKRNSEEWERTKDRLIRSLFEDISVPSPVPEEAVSYTSSPSNYERHKPCSPLPELIVEVVKKPNPHDDPEEYYVALERRMRKYYRKLMKNKEDNCDSSDSSFIENERLTKRSLPCREIDDAKVSGIFAHKDNKPQSAENNESEVKLESDTEFYSSVSNVRIARITKCSAVVKNEEEGRPSSNHESSANSTISTKESTSSSADTRLEGNEERASEKSRTSIASLNVPEVLNRQHLPHGSLEKDGNEECTSEKSRSSTSSINEPEAMRRQHFNSTHGSLENNGNEECTSEKSRSSTSSINEPEAMRRQHFNSTHGSLENNGNGKCTSEKSMSSTANINEPEVMRRQHHISPHGSLENDGNIGDSLNQCISYSTEQLLATSAIESNVAEPSYDDFKISYLDRCSTPRVSIHESHFSLYQSRENVSGSNEDKPEKNGNDTTLNKIEASGKSAISSETIESDIVHEKLKLSSSTSESDSHSEIDQSPTFTPNTGIVDNLPKLHKATGNVSEVNKVDREVQTSPVEKNINWEILKHNFFVGTPKIYNLCYCKNHQCTD